MSDIKNKSRIRAEAGVNLPAETTNRALTVDSNGDLKSSTVTTTELGYVSGVTSSIQTQIDSKIDLTEKGANNGVATLDGGGKIPISQLPSSVMHYLGNWDASTNTPTLADGVGDPGDVYRVNVAGTQDLGSGPQTFSLGDWVVYSAGGVWEKSINSNAVVSVNGQSGIVLLDTDDIPEGTNLYFTDSRAQAAITGAASTIITTDLTVNRALQSNGSGKVVVSNVTATELSNLEGSTSNIQDQIDAIPTMLAARNEFTLTGTDITNQYVDLSEVMVANTERFTRLGVVQRMGYDYSVSLTGGAGGNTRISFLANGDLGVNSLNPLVVGEVITIQYIYQMGVGGGGGGSVTFPLNAGILGSNTSPVYQMVDNDSGMYSEGDGNVSFAANGIKKVSIDQNDVTVLGEFIVTGNITALNYPPTGPANRFTVYDNAGNLSGANGIQIDTTTGGINENLLEQPNDVGGGYSLNTFSINFEPLQDSPSDAWNLNNNYVNMDNNSSGFDQGTAGEAITIQNNYIRHQGAGDVGGLVLNKNSFDIGNGTDPISVNGLSYSYGFGNINDNVTLTGPVQGYGFQPNIASTATFTPNQGIRAFYDFANIDGAIEGYESFIANPQIEEIINGKNYIGVNLGANVNTLTGNAGFTGVGVYPQIGSVGPNGNFQGVSISPNITLNNNNAVGLNVNMNNVTNFSGANASVLVQDITFTFIEIGSNGNNYSIQYTDTTTAGNEIASIAGNLITIQIESGVSTATQIQTAISINPTLSGGIIVNITGVGSNPQTAVGPQPFTGGINGGRKRAAEFVGDVDIQGSLSFTGQLSIGALNSFGTKDLATLGPGVNSISNLITQPTVAANETISGFDVLGVNTAMLLTIGDNTTITSNFLGYSALGLPAVVSMGSGSTIDRVSGATFAISLDAGATGGTIDEVSLCNTLAIPNGATTVNKLKGYAMDLPFGNPASSAWGVYIAPSINNYMAGALKIGSGGDIPDSGYSLHVEGETKIFAGSGVVLDINSTGLGLFNATPVAQQTSSGPQTAGGTYSATEQTMIQEMYNALRAYGLLS